MANILIGQGPFQASVIIRLWRADKSRKGAVVEGFRERIVCVQLKILARSFSGLEREPVIGRISGRIGVIEDPAGDRKSTRRGGEGGIQYPERIDIFVRSRFLPKRRAHV